MGRLCQAVKTQLNGWIAMMLAVAKALILLLQCHSRRRILFGRTSRLLDPKTLHWRIKLPACLWEDQCIRRGQDYFVQSLAALHLVLSVIVAGAT